MNRLPTPWIEPAHPSVVRLYEGLVQVYRSMKENQSRIDLLFDRVASQIGFVVTTTLPVRAEVEDKGKVRSFELDGEALRGTLFATEFASFLEEHRSRTFASVPGGTYRFYLVWSNALLLNRKLDPYEWVIGPFYWTMQPGPAAGAVIRPEVQEPAHWLDPRVALPVEDILTITAIDTVYPELHLAERISASRMAVRRLGSYPQEPAHFVRPEVREPAHFGQAFVRPEVREPAHFRDIATREGFIEELRAIFQKYGM